MPIGLTAFGGRDWACDECFSLILLSIYPVKRVMTIQPSKYFSKDSARV